MSVFAYFPGLRCEIQVMASFERSSFLHLSPPDTIQKIDLEFTTLEADGIILYTVCIARFYMHNLELRLGNEFN